MTQACVERLHTRPEALLDHQETYDHLGEVRCVVQDLRPVLEEARSARTVYVAEEQADLTLEAEFPVPPAIVWEYTIDAEKVNLWKGGQVSTNQPAAGRMRREAEQHCAHGASVTVLQFTDVRPFRYYSHCSGKGTMQGIDCTYEFTALPNGGTRLTNRFYFHRRGLVAPLMAAMFRLMYRKKVDADYARLRALLEALPREPR